MIYTTGYLQKGWTPEKLWRAAKDRNAVVVDTRYSAKSQRSEWCYRDLSMTLGKRYYYWCPALGNENYKGGPIKIADPNKGMADIEYILGKGSSVILMCACKDLLSCHRYHVAQMLVECLGVVYEEIKPPSAQLRLI